MFLLVMIIIVQFHAIPAVYTVQLDSNETLVNQLIKKGGSAIGHCRANDATCEAFF